MQGKRVLKKQSNKNGLLSTYFVSLFSVMLCFVMLLGTTFAWFYTDNTSAGNVINSGRLMVDMIHVTQEGEFSLRANPGHKVFSTQTKWTPGSKQIETLRVRNVGNVPLKYKLDFEPGGQNDVEQTVIDLFTVRVKDGHTGRWTPNVSLSKVLNREENCYLFVGSKDLEPREEQLLQIELCMGTSNNLARAMKEEIHFDLKLDAVQPVAQEEPIWP